jgi:hypothetical protein
MRQRYRLYKVHWFGPFKWVRPYDPHRKYKVITGIVIVVLVGLALLCSFASLFPRG